MLAPRLCKNHNRRLIGFTGWCAALALPIDAERGGGFTIGGAVFEDAADPLMSGVGDVTVTVRRVGVRGAFSATINPLGSWRIDEVPEGTYPVSFRPGGIHAPAGKRPNKMNVNEENEADNLSIQWLVPEKLLWGAAPPRAARRTETGCKLWRE